MSNDYECDNSDPLAVDVSIYGHMPSEIWPTGEQVSTDLILANINRIRRVRAAREVHILGMAPPEVLFNIREI